MDFLNKALAQVSDLFRSMTPGARISAGLLLVVVVVSLAYLFNRQVVGSSGYLLSGQAFSAGELAAMEAAFGKADLSDYEIEGARIRIPRGKQAAYMGALADANALPSNFGDYLSDATANIGPFTSRQQQEEMTKIALQRELAAIIGQMDGVEKAAVLFKTKKQAGFRQESVTTASVSVKPLGGRTLDEKRVPMIRHLVAGAIGAAPSDVTIVDINGRTYTASESDGAGGAMDDSYLTRMKEYETWFESRVRNALSDVPGVTVTASVELEREAVHTEEQVQIDSKPVTITTSETSTSVSSESGGAGGRPGLSAQQPGANSGASLASASGGNQTSEEKTTSDSQSLPGHTTTKKQMAAHTPKQVSISVGIPSKYYEQVWQERNPVAAGNPPAVPDKAALEAIEAEETAKFRTLVAGIIRPHVISTDPAFDPTSLVTVTTFSRVTLPDLPLPGITERALSWLASYWTTLGMGGLALVSLLMLRSMVRSGPAHVIAETRGAVAADVAAADNEPAEVERVNRLNRWTGSGPSLRDELVEIVREDPDAAAKILRGWIGKGS